VDGKAQLPSQIIISKFWKKGSKTMKRTTFYVFSDECYVGYQKKSHCKRAPI
jgi:hypothetical protein